MTNTGTTTGETPMIGFLAHSGTGKTTLLIELITIFADRNIRIGIIKHAQRHFDIDQKGKDSYRLREAGANKILIGSDKHWALMVDAQKNQQFTLQEYIQRMQQEALDLILAEGFRLQGLPKIELIRPSLGNELFFPQDDEVIAIASDEPLVISTELPIMDINDADMIADFICQRFSIN